VCVDADYDMGNAIVTILIQFFWAFLWCQPGRKRQRKRYGVQGAHLNSLGLFLRTLYGVF
jgi:hypothetical protein